MFKGFRVKDHPYSIKNVKTFEGRNGYGHECTIYEGKKKIAHFLDDGSGALIPSVTWFDPEAKERMMDFIAKQPETEEEFSGGPSSLEFAFQSFVGQLVDEYEQTKKFRRQCRTKTLIRLKEDDPDTYRVVNRAYTPEVKKGVEQHYGENLVEIINERFIK